LRDDSCRYEGIPGKHEPDRLDGGVPAQAHRDIAAGTDADHGTDIVGRFSLTQDHDRPLSEGPPQLGDDGQSLWRPSAACRHPQQGETQPTPQLPFLAQFGNRQHRYDMMFGPGFGQPPLHTVSSQLSAVDESDNGLLWAGLPRKDDVSRRT
jgi:hypothetical protein